MTGLSSRVKISAILLLGLILRLYRLGKYDYWFDEVLCVFQKNSLYGIISGKILDSNPPLYFLLLNLWGRVSEAEFWLRLLSVFFAVATIFLVYYYCRKYIGERIALLSALLLSVNPFHIYYSQEVKMYSLFILLSFISVIALFSALRDERKSHFIIYTLVTAAALYTHYFAIYLVIVEIIALSMAIAVSGFDKKFIKYYSLSLVGIILLYLPWVPIMLREHFFNTSGFVTTWIPKPTIKTFFYTLKNFSVGFSSPRLNYLFASFLYGVLGLIGITRFIRGKKREFIFILLFSLLTPLGLYLASLKAPVYLDRYISFALPFFLLIVSSGMEKFNFKLQVLVVVLVFIFSFFGYKDMYEKIPFIHQAPGEHERISYREPLKYLKSHWKKGDIVGHSCRSTQLSFEYYWGKGAPEQKLLATEKFESYPQPSFWPHSSLLPQIVPDALNGKGDIWVVLSWWDPMDEIDYISIKLKKWMDEHFTLIDEKRFHGIFIYKYERNPHSE
ncbi:MAG: hypothetical protein D6734_10865 [Candidatus Schekmanbacteria bacterium]|nr:MAG: hypothetical protein D6734_10865 [Candidatus Schekmanbacteria bacterium]